ncbi:MAG: DUF4349 domain-containing protein [Terriglobia bacterium]
MAKHGVEGEELQAYLDGELEPTRQAEIERHLRTCQECAALVADLKRVSERLQHWQVEPVPASLCAPSVGTVKRAVPWNWWWRPGLALAAAAAIVLLVVSLSGPNLLRKGSETVSLSAPPAEPPPVTETEKRAESENRALGYSAREKQEEARGQRAAQAPPPRSRDVLEELPRARADADAPAKLVERKSAAGKVGGVVGGLATDNFRERAVQERDNARAFEPELQQALKSLPSVADEVVVSEGRLRAKRGLALPMIARQVTMTVEVKESAAAKEKVVEAVEAAGGYVAQASATEAPGRAPRVDLVLRVPAEQLSEVLEVIRTLGRVVSEELSTEEVTDQVVDLEARLGNARATEQRLIAVLQQRTGKVGDILQVEREIARTRQEIERMEARRENLRNRVELATLTLTLVEEYQAELQPAPVGTGTRLRNAFVEGYQNFVATLLGFVFFFARYGLNLLFWVGLLWLMWRALRRPLLRRIAPREN